MHFFPTLGESELVRPWNLAEVNYGYLKEHRYEVAVLPCGATEPHNLHLPYGTDLFEGTIVGERICAAAHEQGAKVALCPQFLTAPRPTRWPFRWP